MGKFNTSSIRGMDKAQAVKEKIGEGLLSDVSKGNTKEDLKEISIPRNLIRKNPNNKYSIEGIRGLAENIRVRGLIQRCEVKAEEDGTYTLLGGERRLTAIDWLIENPEVPEWTETSLVRCILSDPKKIDLELSEENKERYAILSTNQWNRKYNNADMVMEIEEWGKIIAELRANGVESIFGYDEEQNEKEIQIKGAKTKDIISQTTGASRGIINDVTYVQKHGSDELVGALMDNKVSISTAAKAARELDKEEQKDLAKASAEKKVTGKDIYKFKKVSENNQKVITPQEFKKDIKGITKLIKDKEIVLDETSLKSYYSYIEKLEKLLGVRYDT